MFAIRRSPIAKGGLLLTAVLAVAALAGCSTDATPASSASSSSSSTPTALKFQTSWIAGVQFGGSYIADSKGYYKKNGVDVTILPGGPDVSPESAVESGTADIGVSGADTIARANEQGADLVIIGAGFQKNPLALLSLASDPIKTPQDMIGKKIGVPTNTATHEAFLKLNGVDSSKVPTVPVGFDVAPLTSKQVDALYVFYAEQPVALAQAGVKGYTMLASDFGLNTYSNAYFVKRSFLKSHLAAVKGFMTGEILGWQDYMADPTSSTSLITSDYGKDLKLDPATLNLQAARQPALIASDATKANGLFYMSDGDIASNVSSIKALGVPSVTSDLFDDSVLKSIYKGANKL